GVGRGGGPAGWRGSTGRLRPDGGGAPPAPPGSPAGGAGARIARAHASAMIRLTTAGGGRRKARSGSTRGAYDSTVTGRPRTCRGGRGACSRSRVYAPTAPAGGGTGRRPPPWLRAARTSGPAAPRGRVGAPAKAPP